MTEKILRKTYSVCPVCLKRIEAERVERDGAVYLNKSCPEHGDFSAIIWRNNLDMDEWAGSEAPVKEGENTGCPHSCGLCPEHRRKTCCVLLEVTDRCNLRCPHCFAPAKNSADPSFEHILKQLKDLTVPGKTLVQLSGGEPTVRGDLPKIVAAAKRAGCKYVQLNTNGIRLGREERYVKALAEAGLSFVFMQFDGTKDAINEKLRGRKLLKYKLKAIENCSRYNIGVTLVPMLVPGVNTDNIGSILKFAVSNSPAVRGVHFQPVTYLGRAAAYPPDNLRYTLDELIAEVTSQTDVAISAENLTPSCCDHPLCGFHGDFIVMPDKTLMPLSRRKKSSASQSSDGDPADKNRSFVARRWLRDKSASLPDSFKGDIHDMDYFLKRVKSHGFTITSMSFQDAGNLDLERLRKCSLHVYKDGKFIPFCSRYLTAWPLKDSPEGQDDDSHR